MGTTWHLVADGVHNTCHICIRTAHFVIYFTGWHLLEPFRAEAQVCLCSLNAAACQALHLGLRAAGSFYITPKDNEQEGTKLNEHKQPHNTVHHVRGQDCTMCYTLSA